MGSIFWSLSSLNFLKFNKNVNYIIFSLSYLFHVCFPQNSPFPVLEPLLLYIHINTSCWVCSVLTCMHASRADRYRITNGSSFLRKTNSSSSCSLLSVLILGWNSWDSHHLHWSVSPVLNCSSLIPVAILRFNRCTFPVIDGKTDSEMLVPCL